MTLIPRQFGEPYDIDDFDSNNLGARLWPEVHETLAAVAMIRADAVLQILRGQGVYYGLGIAVQPASVPSFPIEGRHGPRIGRYRAHPRRPILRRHEAD